MTTTEKAIAYDIDPAHATAQFTVRHLMISNVRGIFRKVTGAAVWNPEDLSASNLDAEIDVLSIDTQEPQRDEHLKSADFFDAANHPKMTFHSTKFEAAGGDLKITGDLTIRGVTKQVTFVADWPTDSIKDPWGLTRIGSSATAKINRKDFGLTWNASLDAGGVVVGDEVKISLDVELIQK